MQTAIVKQTLNLPTTTFNKLTVDERYFYDAQFDNTIKEYEEKKLHDTNSGYRGAELARYHIGKAMETVYEMVGLKKDSYPSPELARRIAKFIQVTFPYITPGEIITAVEFGLQGKYNNLNSEGKSIFEHYGTMDLPYINTFMQAYVRFRYEKKVSLSQKLEKAVKPTIHNVKENLKKNDEAVKSLLVEAFEQYKLYPDEKVNWLRDTWFYWLVDIGLIEYDRQKLNDRFYTVRSVRRDLNAKECMHVVCVEKIYEMFERLKDQENPFEIFKTVTYVNAETYSQLGETDEA